MNRFMSLIRRVNRYYLPVLVVFVCVICQLILNNEDLTVAEYLLGKAIYLYTTYIASISSLDDSESIERYRKREYNLLNYLIYGFSNKEELGLIVQHNIGTGGINKWSVLSEYSNLDSRSELGNSYLVEIEEYRELVDGLSFDMKEGRIKDEIFLNILVSRELLEKKNTLKEKLTKPVHCNIKNLCTSVYFQTSRVKVIHEINDLMRNNNNSKNDSDISDPGIVIYIHGGGFVFGDFDSYKTILRRHAVELGKSQNPSVIFYIEYRKSPKWKYPIPLEDVILSVSWIFNNANKLGLNPNKLVILGDSAGGNLATSSIASCLNLRDELKYENNSDSYRKRYYHCNWVESVKYLGLIYPSLCQKCITKSKIWDYKIGFLNMGAMSWFEKQYQSNYLNSYFDWRSQPLLTPVNILKKFPRTGIVLLKNDILHDEGKLMYEILKRIKVKANAKICTGRLKKNVQNY
ncbi:hypothetical protein FG386_001285 [Cryptosporidium ryanae]|uniref:uncharacterized protein n=1 Tax=Cryptosporidium ryanae TaxID=515981 RepID=UPI00351A8B0C|nr:hypothetical protein FG386_001285 [Cryptosporidium ryanae]